MRILAGLLILAGLSACDQRTPDQANADLAGPPAPVTYQWLAGTDRAGVLAHGERLSKVLGCQGCHGEKLQGQNFTADPTGWGDHYAENLSLLLADYSDEDLDRAIRQGHPKDGRAMVFMPSEMFEHLSDDDFHALVAYLRTIKPGGRPMPESKIGPQVAQWARDNNIDLTKSLHEQWKGRAPVDLGASHALGRYISRTACTECHNVELQGYVNFSPDLDIAASYNAEEFRQLMREGKGKNQLGMMAWAAQTRFAHLTDAEIGALHDYLKARAERPQAPQ